jgi:riboflavin kinase/FMN adenylyltransferase
MRIHRGFDLGLPACALTIGNFDGVHRGHQAMLALLTNEARHRGLPSCVMTFEPHPRDYFAALQRPPRTGAGAHQHAARQAGELERCGIDHVVVARFDERFASAGPQAFIDDVLVQGLRARYVLVGDDFSFGARRAGNYAMLDAPAHAPASTSRACSATRCTVCAFPARRCATRWRLATCPGPQALLGRPYSISGHVLHGRKLGRESGLSHPEPALSLTPAGGAWGSSPCKVHGLSGKPAAWAWPAWACDPPSKTPAACCWKCTACNGPTTLGAEGGYGRCVRVELLHKLRDEKRYDTLADLQAAIAQDSQQAQQWLALQA